MGSVGSVVLGQWWLTLRLAVALTYVKTKTVTAAAEAAAKSAGILRELDDDEWLHTIGIPTQKLAHETLPLLSDGWGPSLVAIMVGCAANGIGLGAVLYELPQHTWDDPVAGPVHQVFAGITVGCLALPVLLALAPAGVSIECDELTDSLTDLHTTSRHDQMVPLQTILDRANRKQGIGFCITRGWVLDKKMLYVTAVQVYALVVAAMPLLLSSLEAVPEGDPLCRHGWSRIGGSCMKVFHEEPQTWPAAESICEAYDGHLVDIGSPAEQDAVTALVRSSGASVAWIGLTDTAEEGAFVWSNGSPQLDFARWSTEVGGQPNNEAGSDRCASYNVGEDCVATVAGKGWYDFPCEVAGAHWFAMYGAAVPDEPVDQHGCYPHKRPFVCSKPALPGTIAFSRAPTVALYTTQQQRNSYCCAVLCCAVLCCAVLCCAVLSLRRELQLRRVLAR
jgi:hypothetical protein